MDIFTHSSINYLVIVDLLLRLLRIRETERHVISGSDGDLQEYFARQGIPETVHSDNGRQFSAREFAIFSNEWDFQYTTSSSYQSNGNAKSSVKLVTRLLKLALLEYRNTITAGMTTRPIWRLLHRPTRSIIPQLDCVRTDDKSNRTEKERKLRRTQYDYNRHARDLPAIKEGSPVLIRDFTSPKQRWKDAHVLKQLSDRSYNVSSQGHVLR